MKTKALYLILVLLLSMLSFSVYSDDEETHPLLEMLAFAPDNEASRSGEIYYMDFRAVENAFDYLEKPDNFADWWESNPWIGFTNRWMSAPNFIQSLMRSGEEIPETVGFDFFDVDRTLSFGRPPNHAVIWGGNFDADSIGAAHTARDYAQNEINGATAWCSSAGCDQGLQTDIAARELGNIFDSGLGRKPPVLIFPDYLGSAFQLEIVENIAATSNGDMSSLAESSDYRTLVEAIIDIDHYSGELVQAQFWSSIYVQLTLDVNNLESACELLQIQECDQNLSAPVWLTDYGYLPAYELVAIADRQEDDEQVAIIVLLYDNEDDAQIAAPELAKRITTFSDAILRGDDELLLDRDVLQPVSVENYVYTSEKTDMSAAVVAVNYYTPTQQEAMRPMARENGAVYHGLLFRVWVNSLYAQGFYPLWLVTVPEESE
jgi:hypothetical protein